MGTEPEFVEPNLDVLQLKFACWDGEVGGWHDLASIKSPADMAEAVRRVKSEPLGCRIVRKRMGTEVVYPQGADDSSMS